MREFVPSDFEIRRFIAEMGFKTITEWEYYGENVNPLAPKRTTETNGATVRLYEATMVSPPELRNARVLLKEFLQPGRELAKNEIQAYKAMDANVTKEYLEAPIVRLLGSFSTDDSFARLAFREFWKNRFPTAPDAPLPGTSFLCFPYGDFAYTAKTAAVNTAPNAPVGNIKNTPLFFKRILEKSRMERIQSGRGTYVRAICSGAIEALRYVHSAGIVHRSLSLESLAVNTIDYDSMRVEVRLKDFGFAKTLEYLCDAGGDGYEYEKLRKADATTPFDVRRYFLCQDISTLAECLLEFTLTIFGAKDSVRMLGIFEGDFDQFRTYCIEDPANENAVTFLDDNDGWEFFQTMLAAKDSYKTTSLEIIAEMPFLNQ